jgi:hypothetical protein
VFWLTLLVSVPALAWFVAMVYSPAMDITAIYATSSFHAYFFSMLLLKQPLSRTTVGSIALAFAGVIVLSLAGSEVDDGGGASNRFLGDVVMMGGTSVYSSMPSAFCTAHVRPSPQTPARIMPRITLRTSGAVVLGLYEVVYKMALPEGHGGIPAVPVHATVGYSALPTYHHQHPSSDSREGSPPLDTDGPASHRQRGVYPANRTPNDSILLSPTLRPQDRRTSSTPLLNGSTNRPASPSPFTDEDPSQLAHPFPHPHKEPHPHVPAALHANFLTSCIGVATALFLWMPIVVLDWTGIEPFRWPGSRGESTLGIWAGLEVVAWGGALYVSAIASRNAKFGSSCCDR